MSQVKFMEIVCGCGEDAVPHSVQESRVVTISTQHENGESYLQGSPTITTNWVLVCKRCGEHLIEEVE